jgi:hypothetical protein
MILALAIPARAEPASGNDWLARCQEGAATADAAKATYCFAYVRGLADGLAIWAGISPETAPACIPTEVEGQQLVEIGKRFLTDHPDARQLAAGIPLAYAFVETWPCKPAHAFVFGPAN